MPRVRPAHSHEQILNSQLTPTMALNRHKAKRRPRRRKRWPLDVALRREGLDETGYAQKLGGFFEQIEGKADVPKLKLMLDGLKEWSRHLEPKRSGVADADGEGPAVVQLVHRVDRPSRLDEPEASEPPSTAEPSW
jgi:hypothetical protein